MSDQLHTDSVVQNCAPLPSNTLLARRFQGHVAFVTGAGSGIGKAAAQRLAAEGASVVCADLDTDSAENVAAEIAATGGRAIGLGVDITDEEMLGRRLDQLESWASAPLSILIANAGVAGPVGDFTTVDLQDLHQLIAVNLTGQMLCARVALPRLLRGGRGNIVFTASHVAFASVPHWTPYAATKAGVVALARGLAVEQAPNGIRVNCVCPGPVSTPLLKRGWDQASNDADSATAARGRSGTPAEIASVIAFLASEDASLVTGAALVADGGALAHMGTSWPSPTYWD